MANGQIYARNIGAALARAIPAQADRLRAATDAYVARLAALDAEARRTFATLPAPKRRAITSHDAFGYLGAAYGITFLAPVGISTEGEPSARHVAALIRQMRREHIRALFVENITEPRLVQQLAREVGGVVGPRLYSDALSRPDGPAATYEAMFRYNVTTLAQGLARN
jgi:zinc/manganese transport system substrate-binding protein